MKECNKQICSIPLPDHKFSHTELGIVSAQEDGFSQGWKAALEYVLNEMNVDKFKDNGELRTFINEELNGTA